MVQKWAVPGRTRSNGSNARNFSNPAKQHGSVRFDFHIVRAQSLLLKLKNINAKLTDSYSRYMMIEPELVRLFTELKQEMSLCSNILAYSSLLDCSRILRERIGENAKYAGALKDIEERLGKPS